MPCVHLPYLRHINTSIGMLYTTDILRCCVPASSFKLHSLDVWPTPPQYYLNDFTLVCAALSALCPNLKELIIDACAPFHVAPLHTLRQLRSLGITLSLQQPQLQQAVDDIAQLSALTRLSLSSWIQKEEEEKSSDVDVSSLSQLTALRYLKLGTTDDYCDACNVSGLGSVARGCHQLTKLCLGDLGISMFKLGNMSSAGGASSSRGHGHSSQKLEDGDGCWASLEELASCGNMWRVHNLAEGAFVRRPHT